MGCFDEDDSSDEERSNERRRRKENLSLEWLENGSGDEKNCSDRVNDVGSSYGRDAKQGGDSDSGGDGGRDFSGDSDVDPLDLYMQGIKSDGKDDKKGKRRAVRCHYSLIA